MASHNANASRLTNLTEQAILRGIMEVKGDRITYHLHRQKSYRITDPEEQVRADTLAFLVVELGYDSRLIETEVIGAHNNAADIVLFSDVQCKTPYLVVENKKRFSSQAERNEGTEQAFANAITLRARYALADFGDESVLYDIDNYPPRERLKNRMGDRNVIPRNYEHPVTFPLIAGNSQYDIKPASANELESSVKRSHALIWAGGKRDPLTAFDEWSKLMLAKIYDERYTSNGRPRQFQIGVGESVSATASRIRTLFESAQKANPGIFPEETPIELPDVKVAQTVSTIQHISFIGTDADTIGAAFESFYGSVFRGQLGQYFTMRPIVRFIIAALSPGLNDNVLDPTCGSGGFLLETLLQVWNRADAEYAGRDDLDRLKADFASQHVFGIEIHDVLARICRINLLLHHDGQTNIEADKSCLSPHLTKPILQSGGGFQYVVGNPPFGSSIFEGDLDQLDGRSLSEFELGKDKTSIQSELMVLEQGMRMLEPGGYLGMVLPDGVLNNSGSGSNCPSFRRWLFEQGRILGVVSLPDHAFKHAGATNKTSILFFQKFNEKEKERFNAARLQDDADISSILKTALLDYPVFFAEANHIGYTPSGLAEQRNDLYDNRSGMYPTGDQAGTILGGWKALRSGCKSEDPRWVIINASDVWRGHPSHRIDPKYHVYKAHSNDHIPPGWITKQLGDVVERRRETPDFESNSDREFKVLTLSQTGDIRLRQPGIGNNPPEWRSMYFMDSPSTWFVVHTGDIVYSAIDLWKGVVCYVTPEFDGGLVTSEYPVLKVVDEETIPEFLFVLLRSQRLRRAFRAINTGHSNRRRTQNADFNNVAVFLPPVDVQQALIDRKFSARIRKKAADEELEKVQAELDALMLPQDEWTDSIIAI